MIAQDDFSSIANTIRNSEIKLIFKKLAKHNESVVKSGLTDLINSLPKIDYNTTFCEIVGHCCVAFDHFLYDDDDEVRKMSLKMISQIIVRLKRDIVGYATLIFPMLLIYCNDYKVHQEAEKVLEISFPTEEKKLALLNKMQYDICEKISSTLASIKTLLLTNFSIGRVSAACITLTTSIIQKIGKTDFVNNLLSNIKIYEMLKITEQQFAPSVTQEFRIAAYDFLQYEDPHQISNILNLFLFEDSNLAQASLVKLIISLIEKEQLSADEFRPIFEKSSNLYLNPPANLSNLLNLINDDQYIWSIIQKISSSDSQKLFDMLFALLENKNIIIPLFPKMISKDEQSPFLKTCPFSLFEFAKNDPQIDEYLMAKDTDEKRCLEFILSYYNEEKAKKWLNTRESITTYCGLELEKKFSSKMFIELWPNFESIPFSDDEYFIDFMSFYLTRESFPLFLKKYKDSIPNLLKKWTRDYSILNCTQLSDLSLEYLESDPSLAQYFIKIFPNDESITDILSAIVLNSIQSGNKIESSVFNYFTPTDSFLKTFLFSASSLSSLKPGHILINPLIEAIPRLIPQNECSVLAPLVITFVTNSKIDPLSIKFDYIENPLFTVKYFDHFGYNLIEAETFCRFLESYLRTKVPWLPVYLYIKDINWQLISDQIWNFLNQKPDYAPICHSLNLFLALSCVCAASESDVVIKKLPHDYLTYNAMPAIEPHKDYVPSEEMEIIRMEWLLRRPKPPDFSETDKSKYELVLRQTVVYLRFFLPTLMVFKPVYDLILRVLDDCQTRLLFFYCVRTISIINNVYSAPEKSDAEAENQKEEEENSLDNMPAAEFLEKFIIYVVKFAPFTSAIEKELISAFSIAKRLKKDEFSKVAIKCAPLFASSLSTQLVRLMIPLFQYFNSWELLNTNLDGQLDLSNVLSWNFITNALFSMPSGIRTHFVKKYSKKVPEILNEVPSNSYQFEQIVIAFPVTFSEWLKDLHKKINDTNKMISMNDNRIANTDGHNIDVNELKETNERNKTKYNSVIRDLKQKVTRNVFKSIVKETIHLKLENSTIRSNVNALSLGVSYKEDELAMPITVDLRFPETFPAEDIKISTDIGDNTLNNVCDNKIIDALKLTESVVAGIKEWHRFVIQRVKDAEPCPICYSYFSSDAKQTPSVKCSVCGQTFHKTCLRKWFEKCLYRTCPACASRWKEAGK